jgi:hypothetical protein
MADRVLSISTPLAHDQEEEIIALVTRQCIPDVEAGVSANAEPPPAPPSQASRNDDDAPAPKRARILYTREQLTSLGAKKLRKNLRQLGATAEEATYWLSELSNAQKLRSEHKKASEAKNRDASQQREIEILKQEKEELQQSQEKRERCPYCACCPTCRPAGFALSEPLQPQPPAHALHGNTMPAAHVLHQQLQLQPSGPDGLPFGPTASWSLSLVANTDPPPVHNAQPVPMLGPPAAVIIFEPALDGNEAYENNDQELVPLDQYRFDLPLPPFEPRFSKE